jgi:hypothetical protein
MLHLYVHFPYCVQVGLGERAKAFLIATYTGGNRYDPLSGYLRLSVHILDPVVFTCPLRQ